MSDISVQAWREFSNSAALLEEERVRLHDQYRNKWIGIYKGTVEAAADTFDDVAAILARKNIPMSESLVRFIGQKEMTLIL